MSREPLAEADAPTVHPATAPGKPPAFKEWSLVCDALGCGDQSVILRKGGIHEGREGFWWRNSRFFLFPTHFHEQAQQFLWEPDVDEQETPPDTEGHTIRLYAEVDFKAQVTDWAQLERLQPFHRWTEETLRARFDYTDNKGISLAFLRVWALERPWTIPDSPSYGGCRSWLTLPSPPAGLDLKPVLTEAEHDARRAVVRAVVFPEEAGEES